jgi:fermentation-respiration switch protein FrsA (DUF1100 family)
MIIHGKKDNLIPFQHAQELYNSCSDKVPCYLYMPYKMDHNEFSLDHDLVEPIMEFMKHLSRREKRLRLIEKGKKISNINEKAKEDNIIEDSYVNENLDEDYEKVDVKNDKIS